MVIYIDSVVYETSTRGREAEEGGRKYGGEGGGGTQ